MRNPYLCLGIVAALFVIALGAMTCGTLVVLSGKESANVSAALASFISIGSGASGALASFLVMPPKGSVGVTDHDDDGTALARKNVKPAP